MTKRPHGKYVNLENLGLKLMPGEPWFVLRGTDPNSPTMIRAYAKQLEEHGLPKDVWDDLEGLAKRFETWQQENSDLVHMPN